ncbi:hypothetical protein GF314_05760 [bacterium]|nr:hypothetical protein [bacterium]
MPDRDRDLLAAYELNLLTPEERARFEAALADDPDLLEDLYAAAPDTEALLADPGRFAAAARRAQAGSEAARPPGWRRVVERLRPRVLAPVAVAAVLAVIVLWPGGQDLHELASVEPLPTVQVSLRAAAPQADRHFERAMVRYAAGSWSDAARGFAGALAAGGRDWPRHDQAQLYLGSSRLLDGDVAGSRPPLEAASGSPLAPVRDRAQWLLAQGHLLDGDAPRARAVLAELATSPVYGDRATDLLDALPTP